MGLEKLIRNPENCDVKISKKEQNFRKTFPSFEETKDKCPLKCTACSLNLTPFIASGNSCHLHTFLKVLVCKKCKTFYGDGDFSTDEDGDEKYCRWCGEGGKLIFCDKCNCGFCKGCIKRNFSRDFYNELRSSESWDCFLCKPEPLFELRAKACAAEKYFISHSKKEHHKNKNERQPETSKDTKNAKISSVSTKPATNGDKKETLVVARKWLGEAMDNALDLAEQIQIKSKKIKEKKITDASIQSCDDVVTLEVNIQKFYDSLIGNIKEMKVALADDIKLWKSSYTRDLGSGTSSNASGGENGGALQNGDQGGSGDDDDDDTGKKLDGKCDSSKQRGRKSVDSCGGEGSDKESSGRRKSRTTSSSEEEEEVGEKTAQKLTENGASDDDDKSTDNSDRDVDDRSDGGLDLQMECVDKDDGDDDDDDSKSRVKIANSLDEQKKIGKTNEKSRKEVKDSNVDVDGNDSETDGKSENRGKLKNRRRLKNEKGVSDVESIVSNSSVGGNQTADEKSVKSRRSRSSKAESEIDKVGSDASDSEVEAGIKVELQQSAERLLEASSSDDDLLDLDSVAEKQTDQKTKRLSKRSVSHKMDDEEKKSKDTKVESSKSEKEKEEDKESKEIARLANLDSLERSARTVIDSDEENSSEDVKPKLKKPKSPVKKEKASASVSEASGDNSSDSSDDVESDDDEYDDLIDYKLPSFKKNEDCQQKVLQYIFESSLSECSENDTEKEQGKNKKKKTMKKNRISDEDSDDDHKKDDGSDVSVSAANIFQIKQRSWRRDKLLTEKLTDTDTSEDEKRKSKWKRKKQQKESSDSASSDSEDQKLSKKTKEKANIVLSDSDIMEVESESNDSSSSSVLIISKSKKRKRSSSSDGNSSDDFKKKTKKKRKRIINNSSSETEGEGGNEDELNESNASQGKGGRRNIKKIMKDRDVADATRSAAKEEEERRQRILERQKLYNSIYEAVEEKATKTVDKLVLDFDLKTKEPIISVDKGLVAKMKPHQAKGVKFMWDACFESVEQIKTSKGGGCILAHCMGLGKTFQVVSLVHTVLTYKKLTKVKRVLIVCPFSTVLNWNAEFDKWLKEVDKNDDLNVNHLINEKQNYQRSYRLKDWHEEGGVMIMGYDMFRNLTNANSKMFKGKIKKTFQNTLVDPGADLVVCDEGHLLKNEATALSKAMTRIKTLRRIVLTGTPLQNNLVEYHCMVSFIKPNLLGSKKEFQNRFVNPITNGQFVDSTERDFRIMKRRAHVLHKMLDGLVQRRDYNVLTPYLPPKQEYVLSVRLTDLQVQLYQKFLENRGTITKGMKVLLLADFQQLSRVWTHPLALKYTFEKQLKKAEAENNSDSAGSLKDFVVDGSSDDETSSQSSSDNESSNKKGAAKRLTRANKTDDNDLNKMTDDPETLTVADKLAWWSGIVKQEHFDDITVSSKLILLFDFLKECHEIGDKVLVFSQSLYSLDLIEYFLEKIDDATQAGSTDENPQLLGHSGSWSKGLDYFRLDGSSKGEDRSYCIKSFNRESNTRARLFLISTKAGGLGINLTAANRVVIFDASWNPSHDIQSIFRIYRFGQRKPCYIYRFIAQGTMEQKVYERQISKLSLSQRVVDEQQVNRYFTHSDLQELYNFQPAREEDAPTPIVPKDRLMADMLQKHKKWIFKIIEHDSLLDHVEEEELDEAERKAAWEEYENDKKRALTPPSLPQIQIPASAFDFNNVKSCLPPDSYERLVKAFKEKYPHKSEQEIRTIAVQTMTQTYINQENERLARQLLQARQAQSHQQFVQALSVAQNGGQATTYHQPMVGAINRNMVPYSSARPPPAHSSSYSSTSSYRTASPLINSTTSSSSANHGKR